MLSSILLLIKHDCFIFYRNGITACNTLIFFIIVTSLFPMALNLSPNFLEKIAEGIFWMAVLFVNNLGAERLFKSLWTEGAIEPLLLSSLPLSLLVMIKITWHWVVTMLPLILCMPLFAIVFHLPSSKMILLFKSLLLGTPTLTYLSAIGAALVLGVSEGGVLLSILLFPLCVPVLIFGLGHHYLFLAGLLLLSLGLVPWVVAFLLRLSVKFS